MLWGGDIKDDRRHHVEEVIRQRLPIRPSASTSIPTIVWALNTDHQLFCR